MTNTRRVPAAITNRPIMRLLSALARAFGAPPPAPGAALYTRAVAEAREPGWYLGGEVPDTYDGRFDMVALVVAYVTIRLEALEERQLCADLTERFIADMDGTLRQDGVGDQVVGKHIGRMVAALGGRLGAYREAGADDAALAEALKRNLWRGAVIGDDAVGYAIAHIRRLEARLAATSAAKLAAGDWETGQ
jgi:cytochrome b pre-mRNA-processing protein 3